VKYVLVTNKDSQKRTGSRERRVGEGAKSARQTDMYGLGFYLHGRNFICVSDRMSVCILSPDQHLQKKQFLAD
jgi:hypothetical protein